jgi:DNA (cytosine-5)-methyltransferase 1
MKKLSVLELFAGVGGFRVGLEKTGGFEVIWSNQWEPSTKKQHASEVYENVFGVNNHSNEDIHLVNTNDIPDGDVLVGGFPCQDYSVATTLKNSKGIEGKKGVLWWQINRILEEKKVKPKYLILENVDRLIKSPSNQRGRDMAIILKCLEDLGYSVEWRVVNGAEYGFPQRRRRLFLVGYYKTTKQFSKLKNDMEGWIESEGVISKSFPIKKISSFQRLDISKSDIKDISDNFNKSKKNSPFENCGCMVDGKIITSKVFPNFDGKYIHLEDVLESGKVDEEFYIDKKDLDKWNYLKGSKKEIRKSKDGFEYNYSEGGMVFPDALDNASRTIITGEGGKSPSRFKHVINTKYGLRRLTPIELERLNGFPDNHTKMDGVLNTKRAFFMGNALICGVVEKIGKELC